MKSVQSDNLFRNTFERYGKIPSNWQMTKFENLFKPVNLRVKDLKKGQLDIPVLSMTRAKGLVLQAQKFDKRVASRDISPYKVVKHGQLVYGFPMDEGVIAFLHRYEEGVVSPAYQVFEPISKFDMIFMDFFLKSPVLVSIYKLFSSSVVERRRSVSVNDFLRIEIPLPPLSDQRSIAHVLTTVQTAIEQQAKLIDLTRELKSALMGKLFTEGLRGEKQKETEIGLVPAGWNLRKCDELCEMITVGVVVKPASHYVESGVPAFRSLNVREDKLETHDLVFFSEKSNNTILSKSKLRKNDVLIVRTGYPGTSCVVTEEFDGANCIDLVIARPDQEKIVSGYLSRFFNSPMGKRQAIMAKHGLAQQHLNVSAVKSTLIPVPSLDQQIQIDSILKTIDQKIEFLIQKKKMQEELFRTLLHQLMTGEVRTADLRGLLDGADKESG